MQDDAESIPHPGLTDVPYIILNPEYSDSEFQPLWSVIKVTHYLLQIA